MKTQTFFGGATAPTPHVAIPQPETAAPAAQPVATPPAPATAASGTEKTQKVDK